MTTTTPYHHGDLPAALVAAAMELLEENGAAELSLRAVARRAGVSTGAPYRHFPDRTALLSAIAAVGYVDLARDLSAVGTPDTPEGLAAIAVEYVRFALRRPGMFRVMFAEGCDAGSADRVSAVEAIKEYLAWVVRQAVPDADPDAMGIAMWSLVHGLAFLHLDGKLDVSSPDEVAARVRSAVLAIVGARGDGARGSGAGGGGAGGGGA